MSTNTETDVRSATSSTAPRVIDPITMAFSSDPVLRWLYPDPHQYLVYAPEFFRIYAGKGIAHGAAYYLENALAGALWHPPGVNADDEAMVAHIEQTVPEHRHAGLWEMAERIEQYRPDEPHWTLRLIGVDPMQQGKGFGTSLMRHGLEECDREQAYAYLESSNPQNLSLYIRHGFEILGTVSADTMPPLIPMVRNPPG